MAPSLRASELQSTGEVPAGIEALRAGRAIVIVTGAGHDALGHITLAAQDVDPLQLALLVRYSSGFLAVPMLEADLDRLDLPLMRHADTGSLAAPWAVSVDAAHGIETGISARDRATTAQLLADPASTAEDFTRPGHMIPIRTHQAGVFGESGAAEASVDLCRLAGKRPAAVVGVFTKDDGAEADHSEVIAFAREHGMPIVTVEQVLSHRLSVETTIRFTSRVLLDDVTPRTEVMSFEDLTDGTVGLVLIRGDVRASVPVVSVERRCAAMISGLECACTRRRTTAAGTLAGDGAGVFIEVDPGLAATARSYGNPRERHRPVNDAEMETAGRVLSALALPPVRPTSASPGDWPRGPVLSAPDGAGST